MPQIWMTYVELGSLLECSPNEARDQAISVYADRKVSRDGLSRVKLNADWMDLFMSQARVDDRFNRAAREIRALPHMQSPAQQPQPQPQFLDADEVQAA